MVQCITLPTSTSALKRGHSSVLAILQDVDSKQLDEQLAAARARYNELRAAAQAEKASIPARKEGSGHRDAGASPQVGSYSVLSYKR